MIERILLALLLTAGAGCMVGVLRIILPGPAVRSDAALARLTTPRLLLTGLLPIVGAALLGRAAEASGVQALGIVWGVVIALPLLVLGLVGALAAVPHLGAGLLPRGAERSLLVRSVTGALVLGLGLAAAAAGLRQGSWLLVLLVLGWFLGAGLGTLFRPEAARPGPGEEVDDL